MHVNNYNDYDNNNDAHKSCGGDCNSEWLLTAKNSIYKKSLIWIYLAKERKSKRENKLKRELI